MARLTARTIEALRPSQTRQEIPDALLPGLYLVVQPSGAKSWAVRYRHHGKPRKHTIGPYPRISLQKARDLGGKSLREVDEGRDPASEKAEARAARPDSLEHVAEQFFERHIKRNYKPHSGKEAERLLRLHIIEPWRGRTLSSLTRREVRDMLDKIVARGTPIMANRVHSLARKFFGWCLENEIIPVSPLAGLKQPAAETSRDRILTDEELRLVWQAADKAGPIFAGMVRLLTLTGQRRGEVAGMQWSELDLERRLWSLPRHRVKNDRAHEVPLSLHSAAVIRALPRIGDRYVFTVNGTAPINGFGKGKDRIAAALPPDMPAWVLHDIRRTVASGMAKLGVSLPVIEKVLNHVSGSFAGIVGVYQRHDFADEKRAALTTWADHVAAIVEKRESKTASRGHR